MDAVMELYDRIVNPNLLIRRLNVTANHVVPEKTVTEKKEYRQLTLLDDVEAEQKERTEEKERLEKEKNLQKAVLAIKKEFDPKGDESSGGRDGERAKQPDRRT
jgi:DNA polymerase V